MTAMKLVPVEPDSDMKLAGGQVALDRVLMKRHSNDLCVGMDNAAKIYVAMLDVAPSPATDSLVEALKRMATDIREAQGVEAYYGGYVVGIDEADWIDMAAAAIASLTAEVEKFRELYSSSLNDALMKSKMYNEAMEEVAARDEEIADLCHDMERLMEANSSLASQVIEAEAEAARLKPDAERYRWLRLRTDGEGHLDANQPVFDEYWAPRLAEGLDAAIDAARSEAAKGEG